MCRTTKGRRGVVTLECKVLCVKDEELTIGRALMLFCAAFHKVSGPSRATLLLRGSPP